MALSKEQVVHVANLARLELAPNDLDRFTDQLNQIVGHVESLKKLDTDKIEPTAHAIPVANVFREDRTRTEETREKTLGQAPDRNGNFYKVPKVIE